MKIKTTIELDRKKLIDNIYIETRIDHKQISEVLEALKKYLYSKDYLDYD